MLNSKHIFEQCETFWIFLIVKLFPIWNTDNWAVSFFLTLQIRVLLFSYRKIIYLNVTLTIFFKFGRLDAQSQGTIGWNCWRVYTWGKHKQYTVGWFYKWNFALDYLVWWSASSLVLRALGTRLRGVHSLMEGAGALYPNLSSDPGRALLTSLR